MSRQLRVLNIAQSDRTGGANRATYRLHRSFSDVGMDSTLLTGRKSVDDPTVVAAQPHRASKFISHAVAFANSRIPHLYSRHQDSLYSTVQLTYGRLDRKVLNSAEVVCVHWIAGGFLNPAQLARIRRPLVWQLWDAWPFTGGCHYPADCSNFQRACGPCPVLGSRRVPDLSRIDFSARKRAYRHLNLTIVSPSKWLAELAQKSALFGGRRIEVIPSGVDLSVFRPHEKRVARNILGLPQDRKIVLFGADAATTDRRKGYQLMPAIMQRLSASAVAKDTTLVVFGGPRYVPQDNNNNSVMPTIHVGRLEDEISLSLLYAAADVLVAPYLEDNLPFVILESLACGTPVVAFAAGGIPDAIEHRHNGALAAVGNTSDLAREIAWVLEDPERRAQLSRAARATAEACFDIQRCAGRFRDLFTELVNQPKIE